MNEEVEGRRVLSGPRIVLVRHGRSAHVHAGWVDREGFLRWREAYEAAAIVEDDLPPLALRELAASAGLVVASDAPRAVASARVLAPGAPVVTSPLLHELALVPPHLGRLRLPLIGWALSFGLRMLVRGESYVTPGERERAGEAGRWLAGLAREHGTIVVVTHASFRSVLAKVLEADGWRREGGRRTNRHWSAWVLV